MRRETHKFIQSIDNGPPYRFLNKEAKRRGLAVQDVLRAVVIPEWLESYQKPFKPSKSKKRMASMPPAKKR